jgi:hypothetical protein
MPHSQILYTVERQHESECHQSKSKLWSYPMNLCMCRPPLDKCQQNQSYLMPELTNMSRPIGMMNIPIWVRTSCDESAQIIR